MPSLEWVLDTWVLEITRNPFNPQALPALTLLHEIKLHHRIGLDFEHAILNEYFRHAPPASLVGQWLRVMLSRADKVMRRSGRVSAVHTRELLDRLSFDRSDLVFVGVAAEGPDRIIVSEDSDYSSEVRSYLLSEMGVAVVSVEDAIALARVP